MNHPTFVRSIARWLRHFLPALALAVTLSATYQPPQPPPDPNVTQSPPVNERVNWNS
jgi:hypothetical protein